MKTLDDHLAANGPGYLVGDRCTIADIAIWVIRAPRLFDIADLQLELGGGDWVYGH